MDTPVYPILDTAILGKNAAKALGVGAVGEITDPHPHAGIALHAIGRIAFALQFAHLQIGAFRVPKDTDLNGELAVGIKKYGASVAGILGIASIAGITIVSRVTGGAGIASIADTGWDGHRVSRR